MKHLFLPLIIFLFPLFLFAQSGITPEQEAQFRKQMEQFKSDMDQEMQSLRDSLNELNSKMNNEDWSSFDTNSFNSSEAPEREEMPELEELPEWIDIGTSDDTTEVRVGKWNIIVHEGEDGDDDHVQIYKEDCSDYCDDSELDNVKTKFLQMDIGLNNYFGKNFNSKLPPQYQPMEPNPGKSWVVNIHAFDQQLNLIDHHFWLTYGVYFELNSYKYNSDEVMIPNIDTVAFETSDVTLKKNKISCEYIGIPLMFRYESNPRDFSESFHISAGAFWEYLIGARTKVKTTTNDKAKIHDDYNLNRFRYGVTARAGYGWVNLFVNYGLSELLQEGTGPIVYPFSAGLALEF